MVKPSQMAENTAMKYRGPVAAGYDAKRVGQEKWQAEDRIVRALLDGLPASTKILDVPFGTGRFAPLYADKGFEVVGIDISQDMLDRARPKIRYANVDMRIGSIFNLDLPDQSVDVTLAIRIMNLISPSDMQLAIRELQRVTRNRIIFNLRVWRDGSPYRRPQKMETLSAVLDNGWRIVENMEIHEPDFRMLVLEVG